MFHQLKKIWIYTKSILYNITQILNKTNTKEQTSVPKHSVKWPG